MLASIPGNLTSLKIKINKKGFPFSWKTLISYHSMLCLKQNLTTYRFIDGNISRIEYRLPCDIDRRFHF